MNRPSFVLRDGLFLIGTKFEESDLRVENGFMSDIGTSLQSKPGESSYSLRGARVIPALINSHDHLEFNLFPRLGRPPYKNYVEWGMDLQKHFRGEIESILRIPLRTRLLWGAYKNILSGVTTVVHHNPYYYHFFWGFPIDVYKNYVWIHSLEFGESIPKTIRAQTKRLIVHAAEGVDEIAAKEISKIAAAGALTDRTILVHGVGITDSDIALLANSGTGLVWCPGSNDFLFQSTAPIKKLYGKIQVALGTDSTLTGGISLFDELRKARTASSLSPMELLHMVTSVPAKMFGLIKGKIAIGSPADLLIYENDSLHPAETFLNLSPGRISCLMRNGSPLLAQMSHELFFRHSHQNYSRMLVDGKEMLVAGNLPRIKGVINRFIPDSVFNHFNVQSLNNKPL